MRVSATSVDSNDKSIETALDRHELDNQNHHENKRSDLAGPLKDFVFCGYFP